MSPTLRKALLHGELWLSVLIGWLLHLAVMMYMAPPRVILGDQPLLMVDWATHYEQCRRAAETFAASGRTWSWDPHLHGGQLAGTIFDADNKAFELWCIALGKLGVPFDRAFNLVAWVVSALAYPVVWISARLFGARPRAALLAAVLASLVWWFDGFVHWIWLVGMVSWACASYVSLLPIALLVAYLRDRNKRLLLPLALTLAIVHTIHPYAFFGLAIAMLTAYALAFRTLRFAEHAAIAGIAAVTIVVNLWWLLPAARFWHYITDSSAYFLATPSFAIWDALSITKDKWITGLIGNGTGFRTLVIALAVLTLVRLRSRRDASFWPFAAPIGALFLVGYTGGLSVATQQVQPYRLLLPALFLCTVLAGIALDELIEPARALLFDRADRTARALVVVLLVVAVPRCVRDVAESAPQAFLQREDGLDFRYVDDADKRAIVDWVRSVDDGSGRFLIESFGKGETIAEALAGRTDAQILGGFGATNVRHATSNFFRGDARDRPIDARRFREYLERYNVKWVGFVRQHQEIEGQRDLLEPAKLVGGVRFYRVKVPSTWIVGGASATVTAKNDRLSVRGSPGGSFVLRYQWLETLRCTAPGCRIRRVEMQQSEVGFIGVDNAPADIDIVNAP